MLYGSPVTKQEVPITTLARIIFYPFRFIEMDLNEEEAVVLMQKKCRAVFHHYIDQEDKSKQHQYCPTGPNR